MSDTPYQLVNIGILFNAFVSANVSLASLALVFFLRQKWSELNSAMKAYIIFWTFTAAIWIGALIRYILIASGTPLSSILPVDQAIQIFVFLSGISLFYYLGIRLYVGRKMALVLSAISSCFALVSLFFLLQPNGISYFDVSIYSADGQLNFVSQQIFAAEVAVAVVLIVADVWRRFQKRQLAATRLIGHSYLYSAGLLVYIFLAGFDNARLVSDWVLIVFRILYCVAILFIYLIANGEMDKRQKYFITPNLPPPSVS